MALNFEKPTTYGASAVAVYQALKSYGVNADQALGSLQFETDFLRDPSERLSLADWITWVSRAKELSGDPCFGLRVSDFIHPTSYKALGVALLSSSTLRSFFHRWERYFTFITSNRRVSVEERRDGLALTFSLIQPLSDPEVERVLFEGTLAATVKFIRLMYEPGYEPAAVNVTWPADASRHDSYVQYLGPNIVYSSDGAAVCLDFADVDLPLPAASAEMARKNDRVVAQYLARLERSNVPAQVHAKLIELLPSGKCNKTLVADALFMSVRTLHNKLSKSGTSYQALLDSTRKQLAEQYILEQELSVSDVAYLLGFSDSSNFCRAFHRWTGVTPSEFRVSKRGRARDASA
jgi:AraC-like DNA-binding protein